LLEPRELELAVPSPSEERLPLVGRELSPKRWQWHKSSFSGANGCVEVAPVEGGAAVRDSKDPASPVLRFTAREWEAFLARS
jgi:hypothetical protein